MSASFDETFGPLMGEVDEQIEAQITDQYAEFISSKSNDGTFSGFDPGPLPSWMFDFQACLVDYALRKGKAALFADCGTGKTPMQLVWGDAVVRRTNKPVLALTPLAVSYQTVREAEKFSIEAMRSQDGHTAKCIVVTNYERLEHFNPDDFGGVVCDESSILKSFDGVLRARITDFMRRVKYRLLCTATAAPNDYTELGTSSEALGYLGHMDMLNRFFKNDAHTSDTSAKWRVHGGKGQGEHWRFKGHAELAFWRWVCSWSRAMRKPSDLGFADGDFILPPLTENEHFIDSRSLPDGALFPIPAIGLFEQRQERRRTIEERCEALAATTSGHDRSLVWCQLNDEGDLLERLIPGAVQISGSDSDDRKEEAFKAFADGEIPRLITKSKIAGWGLNFQICDHIATFPSHSYEQYYQGVRRCWRFGQLNPVTVDIVATEGEKPVMDNLKRKSKAADEMFSRLVAQMNNALNIERGHNFDQRERIPSWL